MTNLPRPPTPPTKPESRVVWEGPEWGPFPWRIAAIVAACVLLLLLL